MNGYSKYATQARALEEEKERIAAHREGRSERPLDVNYIGPARPGTRAAKQGRSRIAGYSAQRQGGRDQARARAEQRKNDAFTRLNDARSRSFGGLKEFDKMQRSKTFAQAKTPALNAHFGKKSSVVSSDPRGAYDPRKGPQGRPGAVGMDTQVDAADDMNNRVNKDIGAADFPSDVAGFDDVKKGQRGPFSMLTQGGRVKGYSIRSSPQSQSKDPTPSPSPSVAQQSPGKRSQPSPTPPPTQASKPVATSKPESRQPSAPVQKPVAPAKQPTAEQPKMPPLGIGGKIALGVGDNIAEGLRAGKVLLGGEDPGDFRPSYQAGLDEREKMWNGIYKPGRPQKR